MLVAAVAQPMMAYVEIWSAAFRGAGNTKTPGRCLYRTNDCPAQLMLSTRISL